MHILSKIEREKLKKYLWCKDRAWEHEDNLWKKIQTYTPYLKIISWVQCVCICNSLAMNSCHKNSDIDLFVITRKNRLWTARIWLTLLTSLLWIRKTSRKHAWKFCLSFYVTEDEKNFSDIAIDNDIYLSYWLETLIPIINKNNTFEKFVEKNGLEEKYKKSVAKYVCISKSRWWEKCETWKLWDINEYILKKIFLRKTLKNYKKLWKPFGVIISDTMLKFHDQDKRKKIRDAIL